MFLMNITYLAPLEVIDANLQAHRDFLKTGYQQGLLLSSGPKIPRAGGIILGKFESMQEAKNFMSRDPFVVNGLVEIEYIEYDQVMSADYCAS